MTRNRRTLGAALKSKVALAAVRGDKTTAQLASQFGVHTSQVTAWKKRLLEGVPEIFADGRRKSADDQSVSDQELYEQIGRLKVEVEWLKKSPNSWVESEGVKVMDRTGSSRSEHHSAVRTAWVASKHRVLPASRRVAREHADA